MLAAGRGTSDSRERLHARNGLVIGQVALALVLLVSSGRRRCCSTLSPVDPLTYVGVALLLMTTTLLASYVPARRISRVDPAVAMLAE